MTSWPIPCRSATASCRALHPLLSQYMCNTLLRYALSKMHMSQVNCVRHSVKRLQYVPHDLSLQMDAAASVMVGAAAQRDAYVWELCYLRGTWVPYPQDTCRLLEGALAAG
jgi:hypothetical protein